MGKSVHRLRRLFPAILYVNYTAGLAGITISGKKVQDCPLLTGEMAR